MLQLQYDPFTMWGRLAERILNDACTLAEFRISARLVSHVHTELLTCI